MTHRKPITALLLAVALLSACMPAHAQGHGNGPPDHANAGGNGNGNSSGDTGSTGSAGTGGEESDPATPAPETADTPLDTAASPGAPAQPAPSTGNGANAAAATSAPTASPAPDPTTLTPDATLSAVQSGEALPLDAIAAEVRDRSGAEIIDARLLRVGEVLVYAVKTLTSAGAVRTEYYYGRSGLRVE